MRDWGTNQKAYINLAPSSHMKMRGERNSKYIIIVVYWF